jgi:hypothetical protein
MDGITAPRRPEAEQCTGKIPHDGPQEALTEARSIEVAQREPMEVYCCPWCWFWHAGRATNAEEIEAGRERMRQDRIDGHYRHDRLNERKREFKRRARGKPARRRPRQQGRDASK